MISINRMSVVSLLTVMAFITSAPEAFGEVSSGSKEPARPVISPGGVRPAQPRPRTDLPDLVVDGIFVGKTCRVAFKLSNVGPGAIPDAEHDAARVTVYFLKWYPNRDPGELVSTTYYSLKGQVDPDGALKARGGTVTFTTDIILSQPFMVDVHVDSRHNVREANENNNRPDSVELKPDRERCQRGLIRLR